MEKTGFTDSSKAIQTALHSFINENSWEDSAITTTTHSNSDNKGNGAGAIISL